MNRIKKYEAEQQEKARVLKEEEIKKQKKEEDTFWENQYQYFLNIYIGLLLNLNKKICLIIHISIFFSKLFFFSVSF